VINCATPSSLPPSTRPREKGYHRSYIRSGLSNDLLGLERKSLFWIEEVHVVHVGLKCDPSTGG
jgi:hypothetical protein